MAQPCDPEEGPSVGLSETLKHTLPSEIFLPPPAYSPCLSALLFLSSILPSPLPPPSPKGGVNVVQQLSQPSPYFQGRQFPRYISGMSNPVLASGSQEGPGLTRDFNQVYKRGQLLIFLWHFSPCLTALGIRRCMQRMTWRGPKESPTRCVTLDTNSACDLGQVPCLSNPLIFSL